MRIDNCPKCGAKRDGKRGWGVTDSRSQKRSGRIWRRRHCGACKFTVTTYEMSIAGMQAHIEKEVQKRLKQSLHLIIKQVQELQTSP